MNNLFIKIAFEKRSFPWNTIKRSAQAGAGLGFLSSFFQSEDKKDPLGRALKGALIGTGLSPILGSKAVKMLSRTPITALEKSNLMKNKNFKYLAGRHANELDIAKKMKALKLNKDYKGMFGVRGKQLKDWGTSLKEDFKHPIDSLKKQFITTKYNFDDLGNIQKRSPLGNTLMKATYFGAPLSYGIGSLTKKDPTSENEVRGIAELVSAITPKAIPSMSLYSLPNLFYKKKNETPKYPQYPQY